MSPSRIRAAPTASWDRTGGPSLLDGVRERVVADVMEQGGGGDRPGILLDDQPGAPRCAAEVLQRQTGQVEHAERVLEAGVLGTGPDAGDEAELLDPVEPKEGRRGDDRQLRR